MYDAKLPAEHRAIPLWGCEDFYWEDFEIGHRIRTIRRTISEGESMAFNTLVVDIHPYVADEIFAREEGLFGKRLVAGAFGLDRSHTGLDLCDPASPIRLEPLSPCPNPRAARPGPSRRTACRDRRGCSRARWWGLG